VSDGTFNAKKIEEAANAASKLVGLSTALSDVGWINHIIGVGDLTNFGSKLGSFGLGLAEFSTAVSDKEFNASKVKSAADAASKLVGLSTALSDVGWINHIVGVSDLSTFGSKLGSFGLGLAEFSTAVSGKEFNATKIKSAADAAVSIAGVSTALSDVGWIKHIMGVNDLSTFGTQLGGFGDGLAKFSAAVSKETFNVDNVTTAVAAAEGLASLAGTVGENSAGWDWLTGKDSLSDFGTNITNLANGLNTLSTAVSSNEYSSAGVSTAITQIGNMVSLAERLGGEDANLGGLLILGQRLSDLGLKLKTFAENTKDLNGANLQSIATGLMLLSRIEVNNADTLQSFISSLGDISGKGLESFVKTFEDAKETLNEVGGGLVTDVISGMAEKVDDMEIAGTALANKVIDGAESSEVDKAAIAAGGDLVSGFAAGITANTFIAVAAASAMALLALASAKAVLQINSPSKVFMGIGGSVPEGFAMGIDKFGGMVVTSVKTMANNALDGTRKAISRISDIVNSDIDAQPTIRPVLDLSEVEAGAGAIGGMFGMRPSVGLATRVGSISASIGSRQNGGNGDVISAIKDLGKKISNASGDTYNVNGITYDDGSNVTNAVKALIRGVKVERRI
jgi:hypothetical protein